MPRVSVIIPVEPGGDISRPKEALKRLLWPRHLLEVLKVEGQEPSRQRNLAAQKARGQWLLFLDSDASPDAAQLQELCRAALEAGAAVAGGPNLEAEDEPWLGRLFSQVLGSYFGSMAVRARYASLGKTRPCSEKELILCNLLVRREVFERHFGFRENLYPNEENEFLNRLQAAGETLLYVPSALVRRPRRRSLGAFGAQAFRYGRGRMLQIRSNFFPSDLVHLLPLLGLAYGALCPWLWPLGWLARAPLFAYGLADLVASAALLARPDVAAFLVCLFVYPLRHFAYGFGLLAGLFQSAAKPSPALPPLISRVTL